MLMHVYLSLYCCNLRLILLAFAAFLFIFYLKLLLFLIALSIVVFGERKQTATEEHLENYAEFLIMIAIDYDNG